MSAGAAGAEIKGVVFIDSMVPDLQTLLGGVAPGERAFVLDMTRGGLEQIAAILTANDLAGVGSIAVVGHGAPGSITLGTTVLNDAELGQHTAALKTIGAAVAPGGAFDLYSCDTGAGAAGRAFIADLSRVAAVKVEAATHQIGRTARGEDWTLDAVSSPRAAETNGGAPPTGATNPFSASATQNYAGTLATSISGQLLTSLGRTGDAYLNSDGTHGIYRPSGSPNGLDGSAVDTVLGIGVDLALFSTSSGTKEDSFYAGVLTAQVPTAPQSDWQTYYTTVRQGTGNTLQKDVQNRTTAFTSGPAIDPSTHTIYQPIGSDAGSENGIISYNYSVDASGVHFSNIKYLETFQNAVPSYFRQLVYANNNLYIADSSVVVGGSENALYRVATNVTTGSVTTPVELVSSAQLGAGTIIDQVAFDNAHNQVFFNTYNGSAGPTLYVKSNASTSTSATASDFQALTYASGTRPTYGSISALAFDANTRTLYVSNAKPDASNNYSGSEIDELQLSTSGTMVTALTVVKQSAYSAETQTAPITLAFNSLPTLEITGTTASAPKAAAFSLLSNTPTITDFDNGGYLSSGAGGYTSGGYLSSATVTITDNGTAVSGDQLGLVKNGAFNGFTSTPTAYIDNGHTFNVSYANGVLTIANGAGSAGENTIASYKQVLQDVQYVNNSTDTNSRTVTVQVNDGAFGNPAGTFNTKSFALAIAQPPSIVPGGYKVPNLVLAGSSTQADAPGALNGDTSPSGSGSLSVTAVQGSAANVGTAVAGTYGSLTLQSTGAYAYTANNNAVINNAAQGSHPVDTYNFVVTNNGGSASETFAATINRAPITGSITSSVAAGATMTGGSGALLAGDQDPDGDRLSIFPTNGGNRYGTLSVRGDGSYSYAATNGLAIVTANDGQPISDSYVLNVTDGLGGVSTAFFTETVSLAAGGTETVANPTGAATFSLGATTLTINETGATTYGGVIQDGTSGNTGGNLVVSGTAPLTLTGASTYTGATTINANATLALSGGGSLGGTSGVADGGTFDVSAASGPESIRALSGAGTVNLGANSLTITAANGTLSGAITGTGGSLTIATGTQTLSGASSYTGGTTLGTAGGSAASTLLLNAAGAAGTGAITFTTAGGTAKATLMLAAAAQPATGTTLAPGPLFANALANFGGNDELDLAGFTYSALDSAIVDGDTLTFTDTPNGKTERFALSGTHGTAYFVHDAGANGIVIDGTPCYCTGTGIRSWRDGMAIDVPVEALAIGDLVVTATGAHRAIKWIGTRSYAGRFANANPDVLPIRIAAGALADGVPARDLLVSPRHAMYLDGVLIPAERLVNGVTITRVERVDRVTYWHVELDSHDVLLAEGTPAESYLDDDNRAMFHNAGSYVLRYPDTPPAAARGYCAPRLEHGHAVATVRARLARRAGLPMPAPLGAGGLRGAVDGCRRDERGGTRVWGWAQSLAYPDAPVCLEVLADGAVVALAYAQAYRSDLEAGGIGDGRHGFDVSLEQPLPPGTELRVRRALDGTSLPASVASTASTGDTTGGDAAACRMVAPPRRIAHAA